MRRGRERRLFGALSAFWTYFEAFGGDKFKFYFGRAIAASGLPKPLHWAWSRFHLRKIGAGKVLEKVEA
jgi:hypothetical protein